MYTAEELGKAGFLNIYAPDVRDLQDSSTDKAATYCSSFKCAAKSTSRRGVLVTVGQHVGLCPKCNTGVSLYHTSISKLQADKHEKDVADAKFIADWQAESDAADKIVSDKRLTQKYLATWCH